MKAKHLIYTGFVVVVLECVVGIVSCGKVEERIKQADKEAADSYNYQVQHMIDNMNYFRAKNGSCWTVAGVWVDGRLNRVPIYVPKELCK